LRPNPESYLWMGPNFTTWPEPRKIIQNPLRPEHLKQYYILLSVRSFCKIKLIKFGAVWLFFLLQDFQEQVDDFGVKLRSRAVFDYINSFFLGKGFAVRPVAGQSLIDVR